MTLERDGRQLLVVDTQVHVWADEVPDHPWQPEWRRYAHRGGRSPSVAELLADMDSAGVDRAVLVSPTFGGDRANNAAVAAAVAEHPDRFTGMGRLDLAVPRPDDVRTWTARTGLTGIRLTFGRGAAQRWLSDGTADWFWPAAEDAGLPVMVSCPGAVGALLPVLERHPALRLAIDHAGVAPRPPRQPLEVLVERTAPLAAFPDVVVKASALPSLSGEQYPFPTAQRCVRRLVELFGRGRVLWGTDITRNLPGTWAPHVTYLTEPGGLGTDDLESVLGGAAHDWLQSAGVGWR